MKKSLIGLILLVFGSIPAIAQLQLRTVEDAKPTKNQPVLVVGKRLGERSLNNKAAVAADKDWIKDVSIDVKNVSNKPIMAIDVLLVVARQGEMKQPAPFPLEFRAAQPGPSRQMKLLPPGETVTLKVMEHHRLLWMQFLRRYNMEDFKEVSVQVQRVYFGDGTAWMEGREMRQNPDNPDQWDPVRQTTAPPKSIGFSGVFRDIMFVNTLAFVFATPVLPRRFSYSAAKVVAVPLPTPGTPAGCKWYDGTKLQPPCQSEAGCPPDSICNFETNILQTVWNENATTLGIETTDSDHVTNCFDKYNQPPGSCTCANLVEYAYVAADESCPMPTPTPSPTPSPTPVPTTPSCPNAIPRPPLQQACQAGYYPDPNGSIYCCPNPPPPPCGPNGESQVKGDMPSTECGEEPITYSDPPYCVSFYALTDWYISYDGGNSWSYYFTQYTYLGSNCELIIQ